MGLFTSIIVMIFGYLIHVLSHNMNYMNYKIIRYLFLFTCNFHEKIHDDTNINKK